jgi:hypothetical protein
MSRPTFPRPALAAALNVVLRYLARHPERRMCLAACEDNALRVCIWNAAHL